MKGTAGPLFHSRGILFVAVLIVLVLQVLSAAHNRVIFETRGYMGPDSYMRMLRVEKLVEHDHWYDTVSDRTNAPYGETLPWGRPLDGVLAAVAALFSLFTDTRTAVYAAGVALGPLLGLLLIPVWSWGTRPILGGGGFLMLFVLSPFAYILFFNTEAGRADHHGFLALLFTLQLCAAFRLATGTGGRGSALLMGIAGGVMVWGSIMGLIAQIAFSAALAVRFLRGTKDAAYHVFLYTAGLALTFTAALLLERPPAALFEVYYNRLSIAQWTLAAAAAASWWPIQRYFRRRRDDAPLQVRVGALLLGGGIPLAVMAALFPRFFLGPTADYPPDAVAFYFTRISEFQPLIPTSIASLAAFIAQLGYSFIALGFIALDYRKAPDQRRAVYDVLIAGFAVYIPMALWVGRFALYVQILSLVPWVMALGSMMTWNRTVTIRSRDIPVRGLAVIAAVTGPTLLAVFFQLMVTPPPKVATEQDWAAMGDFLTRYAGTTGETGDKAPILLTYILKGPVMAWRTPFRVIGAPYANVPAMRDTNAILLAPTDAEARRVIDRRGVTLFLYCAKEAENKNFRNGESGSFFSRVENGHPPAWLRPVPLPDRLTPLFRLYRVAGR